MKTRRLEVLEKLRKGEITVEQSEKELLVLYNVSDRIRPTWQEIAEHSDSFAKKRNIEPINTFVCFEECAKFIAEYPNRVGKYSE